LKINQKSTNLTLKVKFYAFWQPQWIFGCHLGHEEKFKVAPERILTGKKAVD